MNYIIIFFSQSGALKFNRNMERKDITCTLSPTPRALSSSCGTCAKIFYDGDILDLIEEEIESIFSVEGLKNYNLVYDGHDI
ncbi:MAG TPA: hypothetical protein DC000_12505 [Clostridiales bacterium]|nr:hypothetical protein [Clostridiales bacterium]